MVFKSKKKGKIMIKVSVIVPFFNVENYIEKCLKSLVSQTLADIEIILVNDGSEDKSEEIAKKFVETYPDKITYLKKENGGLSDARNYAIPKARGEYIAFLDSDDYVEINMYEEMYNKAKKENLDYVECDFLWEYPDKVLESKGNIYDNKKEMFIHTRVVAWNKLIKREIIQQNKIEFPKGFRYEDVEFFYKLLPNIQNYGILEKPFIHYVQRENSISNVQNTRTKEIIDVLGHVIDYYKTNNLFAEYEEEIEYTYARYILCSSMLRMVMIENKKERKEMIHLAWESLNTQFPNWKENLYLKEKGLKNLYMKTVNKFTLKMYTSLARLKFIREKLQEKFV